MSGQQAMPAATPAPALAPAAAPSRSEVQRKLSLKSVSHSAAKPRRPSGSTPTTPGLTGYDSDSSYTSSQPVGPSYSQSGGATVGGSAASATSPSIKATTLGGGGSSLQNPGPLAAIAERERKNREGVLVLSDEDEEGDEDGERGVEAGAEAEAEADGSDEEGRVQGPEAGQLRQGVEGERVVRTGYLDKKGERRKSWQRRWFVLRTAKLAYYKDEKEYVLCRIIDLRNIHTVASVQLKRHAHGFGIVTPQRTYYLKAGSQAEMEGWVMALNEARRNLAEGDERARNPQMQPGAAVVTTAGGVAGGAPAGPSGASRVPPLQIPRQSSADAQSPPLASALQTPTGSAPSRSASIGLGTPLDASLNRLGLGASSPAASPQQPHQADRDRQTRERAMSTRRDTSASSVSSAGGTAAGHHPGDLHLPHDLVGATSSDEDDVYAPVRPAVLPGSGAAAGQQGAEVERVQIQTDPNKVIVSGYLMKMGLKRKVWRKRWFVLTSGMLVYTKSHMDTKVHRQIPLAVILDALEWESPNSPLTIDSDSASDADGSSAHPRGDSRRPRFGRESSAHAVQHTFQVITPKRTFKLCAPTEEDEIKWLAALRTLINRERGLMSPAIGVGGGLPPTSTPGGGWSHSGRRPSQPMPAQTPGVPSIQEHPPSPASMDAAVPPPQQASAHVSSQAGEGGSYFGAAAGGASHLTSASQTTLHASTAQSSGGTAPPLSPLYTLPSTTSSTSTASGTSPHPPPTQRTRSATQSAKNAVEVAVRRLHLGQQHPQHHHQQSQPHQQHGHTHLNVVTSAEEQT